MGASANAFAVGKSAASKLALLLALASASLHGQTAHFAGIQTTLGSGLSQPAAVAVDITGNVYIADTGNNRVLKVLAADGSQTLVGSGFSSPRGVAVDAGGNVYVADTGNNRVVKVATDGSQTEVATGLSSPQAVAADAGGDVYIADTGNNEVVKYPWTGTAYSAQVQVARSLSSPRGVALDPAGNVYISEYTTGLVVKAPWDGSHYGRLSTVVSGLLNPTGVAVDAAGDLFIAISGSNQVVVALWNGSAHGTPVNLPGSYSLPSGVAVDARSSYIADTNHNRVVKLASVGDFGSVLLGGAGVSLTLPFVFDSAGTLNGATPYRVLTQGATGLDYAASAGGTCAAGQTYAAGDACTVNVAFTPKYAGLRSGAAVLLDPSGSVIATAHLQGLGIGPQLVFTPGTQSVLASGLNQPSGLAADGSGNIYVADKNNNRVVMVPAGGGSPAPVGSGLNRPGSVALDGAGNLYIADANNNRIVMLPWTGTGFAAQTTVASGLDLPSGVAVDGNGNIYVADTGNDRIVGIRRWLGGYSAPLVIADHLTSPQAVAVDSSGNVYIAESSRVMKALWTGNGYSDPAVIATGFTGALQVAVDGSGNVYGTDNGHNRVLKLAWTGSGYGAQTSLGTALNGCSGVAVDAAGNVYISDLNNNRVVKVDRVSRPSLSFGTVGVGSSSAQGVTLDNIGNAPLSFGVPASGANPSLPGGFSLAGSTTCPRLTSASPAPGALAPGAVCTYMVQFAPAAAQPYSGAMEIADSNLGGIDPTQTLALMGVGAPAAASISASSVSAGYSSYAQTVTLSAAVTASGQPVNEGSVTFTLMSGSATIGAATTGAVAGGAASVSFTIPAQTPPGAYTIQAVHNSSPAASDSSQILTIAVVSTTTAAQAASAEVRSTQQLVTLRATVTASTGAQVNEGAVTFTVLNGATVLGAAKTGTVSSGAASVYYTLPAALPAGIYTIQASYDPGSPSGFLASADSTQPLYIGDVTVFGTVNVGSASAQVDVTINFTRDTVLNAGLGAPYQVLTAGSPNLDFTSSHSTCTALGVVYHAGSSCTVSVVFRPKYAGLRNGAVVVYDNNFNAVATHYLLGTGAAPQVSFSAGAESVLLDTWGWRTDVAVDGAGSIYVADPGNLSVIKLRWNGSGYDPAMVVASGFSGAWMGVAVDGAGSLFVTDWGSPNGLDTGVIYKIPWIGYGYGSRVTLSSGWYRPGSPSVDWLGNVYFRTALDAGGPTPIVKIPRNGSGYDAPTVIFTAPHFRSFSFNQDTDTIGSIYLPAWPASQILPWTPNGYGSMQPIPQASGSYIAVDGAGNVYNSAYDWVPRLARTAKTRSGYGPSTALTGLNRDIFSMALNGSGDVYAEGSNATVVKLTLTQPAPTIFPTPTPAGSVDATDGPQTVTVTNIGNRPLVLSGVNHSNPASFPANTLNTNLCAAGVTLEAGTSCDVSVNFRPQSMGAISGNVVLTYTNLNVAGSTATIVFQGTGIAPLVPVTASVTAANKTYDGNSTATITGCTLAGVASGDTVTCSAASATFATVNAGNGITVTAAGITLGGANASKYGLTSTSATTSANINPATQATLTVTGVPSTPQPYFTFFRVGASGGSGNGAVTFLATGACSMDGASDVEMTSGTGTCSVTATKASDGNYLSTTSATVTVSAALADQAALTVSGVPATPQAYNATFTVASSGGSGTGAVTFAATGACSASGATMTMTSGTGTCSVTATKAADANYSSITSVAASVSAAPAEQAALTVTGVPATPQASGASFTVGASGGSGTGAVTFAATGACTASGVTITMTSGAGVCSVTATKAADTNYASVTSVPATVNKALAEQAALTVTGVPATPQAYNAAFTVGASGGSGTGAVTFAAAGACSASGATITMTSGTGTCSVTATKAADADYSSITSAAATVSAALATQATLAVTGVPATPQPYGASFPVESSGGSGTGAVTFAASGACSASGATITMTNGTGTCSVTATKAADADYSSATSAAATVSAALATQATLAVTGVPAIAQPRGASFPVGASGGSGTGAVTFAAAGACSASGAMVTITSGAGTCSVTAAKAADANYSSNTSAAATVSAAAFGVATRLVFAAQPPASWTAGTPFGAVVQVQDAYGNLVAASADPVTITSTAAGITGTTTVPASGGVATFTNLLLTPGTYTLTASSTDLASAVSTPTIQFGIVSYNVVFGNQTYNLIGTKRVRLPWRITAIRVVFSAPVANGDALSLTGLPVLGFSGLGTNTLTWTVASTAAPILKGAFATGLAATGAHALRDASGNAVAPFGLNFKVLMGDVNDDGVVNSQDMVLVNNGRAATYNLLYDINGDRVVDTNDVSLVRTANGNTQP